VNGVCPVRTVEGPAAGRAGPFSAFALKLDRSPDRSTQVSTAANIARQ
jgi:hypothetical protein